MTTVRYTMQENSLHFILLDSDYLFVKLVLFSIHQDLEYWKNRL